MNRNRYFIIFVSIFLFLFLPRTAHSANPKKFCERTLENLGLSKDAIFSLKEAHESNEYFISALKKTMDGREVLIILFGETHYKNNSAHQIGVKVLKEFPLKGIEGLDTSKLWASKFFSRWWGTYTK